MFDYHRSKYLCLTDTSLNNINLNTNVNLLNDIGIYNRNSNVENRTENSINNSSTISIADHDNSRNLGGIVIELILIIMSIMIIIMNVTILES